MKSEVVPDPSTENAESTLEGQESPAPSSPVVEGNIRGLLQVLGVSLIIFNVW
jgi:hypothetical protein